MKKFPHRILKLAILSFNIFLIVNLSRSIYEIWRKKDIVHEREVALREAQAQNDELKKKIAEAESPEFIEKTAREKLGLVKDNEVVVLMDALKITSKESEDETNPLDSDPNWKRWWRLFF